MAHRRASARPVQALVGCSFIVSEHTDYFDNLLLVEDLIYKTVMDVDSSGIGAVQVTDKLLKRRITSIGVFFEDIEKFLRLCLETRGNQLLCVFLCLFGEDNLPFHQPGSLEHFSMGVFRPCLIDWRIPGIDRRYMVS
jgi:hypothetical protein